MKIFAHFINNCENFQNFNIFPFSLKFLGKEIPFFVFIVKEELTEN
jgi:hypothetical protein